MSSKIFSSVEAFLARLLGKVARKSFPQTPYCVRLHTIPKLLRLVCNHDSRYKLMPIAPRDKSEAIENRPSRNPVGSEAMLGTELLAADIICVAISTWVCRGEAESLGSPR